MPQTNYVRCAVLIVTAEKATEEGCTLTKPGHWLSQQCASEYRVLRDTLLLAHEDVSYRVGQAHHMATMHNLFGNLEVEIDRKLRWPPFVDPRETARVFFRDLGAGITIAITEIEVIKVLLENPEMTRELGECQALQVYVDPSGNIETIIPYRPTATAGYERAEAG